MFGAVGRSEKTNTPVIHLCLGLNSFRNIAISQAGYYYVSARLVAEHGVSTITPLGVGASQQGEYAQGRDPTRFHVKGLPSRVSPIASAYESTPFVVRYAAQLVPICDMFNVRVTTDPQDANPSCLLVLELHSYIPPRGDFSEPPPDRSVFSSVCSSVHRLEQMLVPNASSFVETFDDLHMTDLRMTLLTAPMQFKKVGGRVARSGPSGEDISRLLTRVRSSRGLFEDFQAAQSGLTKPSPLGAASPGARGPASPPPPVAGSVFGLMAQPMALQGRTHDDKVKNHAMERSPELFSSRVLTQCSASPVLRVTYIYLATVNRWANRALKAHGKAGAYQIETHRPSIAEASALPTPSLPGVISQQWQALVNAAQTHPRALCSILLQSRQHSMDGYTERLLHIMPVAVPTKDSPTPMSLDVLCDWFQSVDGGVQWSVDTREALSQTVRDTRMDLARAFSHPPGAARDVNQDVWTQRQLASAWHSVSAIRADALYPEPLTFRTADPNKSTLARVLQMTPTDVYNTVRPSALGCTMQDGEDIVPAPPSPGRADAMCVTSMCRPSSVPQAPTHTEGVTPIPTDGGGAEAGVEAEAEAEAEAGELTLAELGSLAVTDLSSLSGHGLPPNPPKAPSQGTRISSPLARVAAQHNQAPPPSNAHKAPSQGGVGRVAAAMSAARTLTASRSVLFSAAPEPPVQGTKVWVFVHGFQGQSGDMLLVQGLLHAKHCVSPTVQQHLYIVSTANEGKTGDSVIKQGERLIHEIKARVAKIKGPVAEINFIGFSLGNLVVRSCLMHAEMRPYLPLCGTYLSFNGPHLGVLTSGFKGGVVSLFTRFTQQKALKEITLKGNGDVSTTLRLLAAQSHTLSNFRHIVLVGSQGDGIVPIRSALCIPETDAQRGVAAQFLSGIKDVRVTGVHLYYEREELTTNENKVDVAIGKAEHVFVLNDMSTVELCLGVMQS
ncbi:hypothetical protein KIPB_004991 [Kipferlia bialata]|uniref:DUF676 domain-containing protein n=1 Tax=Kipferlia bialata TaxID=797122 RepID=A0A9K3GIK8_9EUKA|nr:hypothetical protein KIPB_004991 [Kipferlia bialata]|eukprot:g4991.t1